MSENKRLHGPSFGILPPELVQFSYRLISPLKLISAMLASLFSLYLIGFDQGGLARLLEMNPPAQMLLHDFFHDFRHVAGFMCH